MSYYTVCRSVTSFREIEEIEEALVLPAFRRLRFVDCNKPFYRALMYKAFLKAKKVVISGMITRCLSHLLERISPSIMNLHLVL